MTVAYIIASTYQTDRFAWSKETQTFSAEASELAWRPGSFSRHIWLVSTRTGDRRLFSLRGSDASGWRYEDAGGLHLVVWND